MIKTRGDYYRELAKVQKGAKRFVRAMEALYGKGNWGNEELAHHLCQKLENKSLAEMDEIPYEITVNETPIETKELPQISSIDEKPKEEIDSDIASEFDFTDTETATRKRMSKYLEMFKPETPNDDLMLWELCRNEAELVKLHERKRVLLDSDSPSAIEIRTLTESTSKLSSEVRNIQKSLGIERATRGQGEDLGAHFLQVIQDSKNLVHRIGIPLICMRCHKEPSEIVNVFGMLIWHFETDTWWEFKYHCPRCNAELTINKESANELRKIAKWR